MSWDTDTQFTEGRLSSVVGGCDGWNLYVEDDWGIWCPSDQCQTAPAAGETGRFYSKGLGYPVRGIIIEGRVYKYLTEEQEKERHAGWVNEENDKRARAEERERQSRDERRAALPEALRERLATYEARNPLWRRDFESYELFVCEEAAALAVRFAGDAEGLRAFNDLGIDEQKQAAPELKFSEHSGNTWAAAVHLAMRLVTDPKLVRGAHGALCPLVGCTEYGCPGADLTKEGKP